MRFQGSEMWKGHRDIEPQLGDWSIGGWPGKLGAREAPAKAPSICRWGLHLCAWLLGWNGGRTGSEGVISQSIQHDSPRTDVLTGWFGVPRTVVFLQAKEEAARLFMTTSETIASLHCSLLVKPVSEPTQVQREKAYTLPLDRRRVKLLEQPQDRHWDTSPMISTVVVKKAIWGKKRLVNYKVKLLITYQLIYTCFLITQPQLNCFCIQYRVDKSPVIYRIEWRPFPLAQIL